MGDDDFNDDAMDIDNLHHLANNQPVCLFLYCLQKFVLILPLLKDGDGEKGAGSNIVDSDSENGNSMSILFIQLR